MVSKASSTINGLTFRPLPDVCRSLRELEQGVAVRVGRGVQLVALVELEVEGGGVFGHGKADALEHIVLVDPVTS